MPPVPDGIRDTGLYDPRISRGIALMISRSRFQSCGPPGRQRNERRKWCVAVALLNRTLVANEWNRTLRTYFGWSREVAPV